MQGARAAFVVIAGAALTAPWGCATSEQAPDPEPPEPFSFAILADTHVQGNVEYEQRLVAAVTWINDNQQVEGIELVLVLGDIGWRDGLGTAKEELDRLVVPYVPITGDNEVHVGDEQAFYETFAPRWAELGAAWESWHLAPAPVANPETGEDSWFTNLSFEVHGMTFIGLDWAARGISGTLGEFGYLHDFDGGTLPWLDQELRARSSTRRDSIVLFSHIPMYWGVFFEAHEFEAIAAVVEPHAKQVYANFAGHTHTTYEESAGDGMWHVFVTDAVHDDENTVRVVDVGWDDDGASFAHELVVVD